MSADVKPDPMAGAFYGLKQLEHSLPSTWYYDPAQYEGMGEPVGVGALANEVVAGLDG